MFDQILDKWKNFIIMMNEKGFPVPMLRDKGQPSVSLTLLFISFNVWLLSVIGKASGALGGMDAGQCLQMFMVCAGLYFGRKLQKTDKGVIVQSDKEKQGE
jgi:hypothetical protein